MCLKVLTTSFSDRFKLIYFLFKKLTSKASNSYWILAKGVRFTEVKDNFLSSDHRHQWMKVSKRQDGSHGNTTEAQPLCTCTRP